MISPQTEAQSRAFLEAKHLTMALLSDPGNGIARKYGLVFKLPDDLKEVYKGFGINLPDYNGDDSWTLPLSARYIIDQGGLIRYAQVSADYTVRPDPSHTINALKSLAGKGR
jgi:peroxiredoxin